MTMQRDGRYSAKIDPHLRDALADAPDDTILHAVMVLDPDADNEESGEPDLHPSAFPSRAAWRRALLARREQQLARDTGRTVDALRDLCLRPRGGTVGRTVVVEGTARHIRASLELPGVLHASLDRSIALDHPQPRSRNVR